MGGSAVASAIMSLGLLLPSRVPSSHASGLTMTATVTGGETAASSGQEEPLLLRAAKGLPVERPPVWMMRQAGRHMQAYRDLCKEYPTFRQRSEIPEVAVEVSLQPWRQYGTDGCILFSDILTPLPGVGIEFDINEKVGPVVEPMRDWDSIKKMHPIDPSTAAPLCRGGPPYPPRRASRRDRSPRFRGLPLHTRHLPRRGKD